jgi:hypothetical protein
MKHLTQTRGGGNYGGNRLSALLGTLGKWPLPGQHSIPPWVLVYEGDDARLDRWLRWIERGKPYLRTELTQNRGIGVVQIADARADPR